VQRQEKRKRLVALVLGVALVVAFGAFVISGDIGDPSIPDGDVAYVDGAPEPGVGEEEFQRNLRQAAFNLQLRELPPEEDPQFEQVQQSALSNSIQSRWVRGEAADRGITASEREVEDAFDSIIEEQLGGQKGYERFLSRSEVDGEPAFDEQAVRDVAELTAISDKLQTDAVPEQAPDIPDEDVELFYEANESQFEQPESRNVRVILNTNAGKIDEALTELRADNSAENWETVAKKYSTDEATKNDGGLRQSVVQGQNEPTLDEAIFLAGTGELVGPIEGQSGSYIAQVEEIIPAQVTPLEDVRDQIVQTMQQGISTQAITDFRNDFIAKWTARTFCAEDLVVDLCANAPDPPDACTIDDESELDQADPALLDAGCPAPVLPRNVVDPGTAGVVPGQQPVTLPQGPFKPAAEQPEGLPPGAQPLGPGGAPPGGPPGAEGAPPTGP